MPRKELPTNEQITKVINDYVITTTSNTYPIFYPNCTTSTHTKMSQPEPENHSQQKDTATMVEEIENKTMTLKDTAAATLPAMVTGFAVGGMAQLNQKILEIVADYLMRDARTGFLGWFRKTKVRLYLHVIRQILRHPGTALALTWVQAIVVAHILGRWAEKAQDENDAAKLAAMQDQFISIATATSQNMGLAVIQMSIQACRSREDPASKVLVESLEDAEAIIRKQHKTTETATKIL